ncbi:permease [Sulfurovum sp. CS9]|uniref:permease n=1 Tax=Sulfurovum sp. CS9 TaxID=3391146 RepID=UPI0039EB4809
MKIPFKGMKFLIIVLIAYIVLLLVDTSNTLSALQKSASILLSLLPLFLLIITLTALINYFLKPKQIIKHFGKESGAKGVFYALVGGIISHGPMYAWYGMLQDMRSHGLKDGLIATFMYARAVKLPLLPFMIDLFGLLFTIVMTLYILIASVLQGKVIDALEKKKS